ncbi:MAG: ABC transporter permease [Candidatus Bathyarchaeia archaeon]
MENGFVAIYWRDMTKFFRSKALLFSALIQPVLWLVLYGISMSSNINLFFPSGSNPPGVVSANYMTFMAAGVVGMTILFTCLYAGQNVQFDKQYGLMKLIVVSPMPRSQILLGVTLGGITKALIQTAIVIAFGYVLGVHFFLGLTIIGVLMAIAGVLLFVVLFSMGLMFLSTAIAMKVRDHNVSQAVITLLTLPLFFASNALYPLDSMPTAIKIASDLNPLTHFINGMRYFGIGSDFYSFGVHYSTSPETLLTSFAFLAGFTLIMFLAAVRAFETTKEF